MALPTKHIRSQGPTLAMLGATAFEAARRAVTGKVPSGVGELPGPEIHATLPPRPHDLIRDYVRWCGGDPSSYKTRFRRICRPQWGFPLPERPSRKSPIPPQGAQRWCRTTVNAMLRQ